MKRFTIEQLEQHATDARAVLESASALRDVLRTDLDQQIEALRASHAFAMKQISKSTRAAQVKLMNVNATLENRKQQS